MIIICLNNDIVITDIIFNEQFLLHRQIHFDIFIQDNNHISKDPTYTLTAPIQAAID